MRFACGALLLVVAMEFVVAYQTLQRLPYCILAGRIPVCTRFLTEIPFSTFTSDAGIKAEPSSLSAVIAQNPTVLVVPLISPQYIPPTLHSERMYGTTSSGFQNRSKSFGHTIVKHRVEPADISRHSYPG